MQIILIRHGKPVLPSLNKISAAEFSTWLKLYDQAGLCSSSMPEKTTLELGSKCKTVVCSALSRSIESAQLLSEDNIHLSSSLFNEAGLPVATIPYLRFSPKVWAVLLRIFWLTGFSRNSESYEEAKVRAAKAAVKLIELSQENSPVLFVGHGVFNRLVANELSAAGWVGPKSPGTKHWSIAVYKQ